MSNLIINDHRHVQDEHENIRKTKKKMIILLIVVLVTLVLPIILVFFFINSLLSSACKNEVVSQVNQPDGINKAVLFVRDCGATTRESYQVTIIKSWNNIDNTDRGNTFISYTSSDIKWLSKDELEISYGAGEVFKEEKVMKGITIRYK